MGQKEVRSIFSGEQTSEFFKNSEVFLSARIRLVAMKPAELAKEAGTLS